ncbi:MAG: DNA methyltransferase [Symbiobacterium sp.]|uniref:DNA methyltransferase n=1 Tax=Symbiobacterium sp. TaxID=1971213 RepID=UPI003464A694
MEEKQDGLKPRHVDMGERGIYHTDNRLNDLTGKEWVYATRSVINKSYPPSFQFQLRSQHGGQKPPELCADLIRTFTKAGERVLDPFMGVGGTLIGATISDRSAVGVEVNPRWVEIYREVCRLEGLTEQEAICGDSRAVLPTFPDEAFDLVLTDVPYWNMDRRRRSTGKFKRAGGPAVERRRSKLSPFAPGETETGVTGLAEKEEWLETMRAVFAQAMRVLRRRRYLVVFIGDMYHSGRYHMLSAQLAELLEGLGLVLKANLIWYDVSKSLHVYGYRYEFIPSMVHQNILVLRKP